MAHAGWCTPGREPGERPLSHTHRVEPGIRTWLSAAPGNTPQKLMLGTSFEILLEAVSGKAVVSVNSVN